MNEPMNEPMNPPADAPQEDRTMALIAHIGGVFTSIVAPLIIWIMNKDKPEKAWLNEQAREALNFQITILIAWFAASILAVVLIGFLLMPIIGLTSLILGIIAGMKNNEGIAYRYPFALRLVK
jgi:uncharacterized Tic20 family protein